MSKIVKILLTICLTVSLLGNLVYPTFAQEAPKKLLVAYAGLISTHTSVWLGEDQGFFKKHGLDVSSVFTGSGSVTSCGCGRRPGCHSPRPASVPQPAPSAREPIS